PIGLAIALIIVAAIARTLYWMLHPPVTKAESAAKRAEADLQDIIGSVVIVFSEEIHSEHMLSLAAKLARRERAKLLAAYFIEVPHTLPVNAEMEVERRDALDVLATAEAIARKNGVEIETDVIPTRSVSQGVLELARRKDAHLIVLGSYREGKYTGAPMARAIEVIAGSAHCDVLIGVQGNLGKILTPPPAATSKKITV
ncbi:MAG: universal stress protein, partial [Candidatus Baltobacteraceae bacterium]